MGSENLVDVLSSSDWSKHIASLHLNEKHSDVVLKIIGQEKIPTTSDDIVDSAASIIKHIPAHSLILRKRSAYFASRLDFEQNSLREMHNKTPTSRMELELKIDSHQRNAIMSLLEFIYTGQTELTEESIVGILTLGKWEYINMISITASSFYSADYFQVPLLTQYCHHNMRNRILGNSNALSILVQFRLNAYPTAEEAQRVCLHYIDLHAQEVLSDLIRKGEGLLGSKGELTLEYLLPELDAQLLRELLTRDSLRIVETDIFAVVVAWATQECHREGKQATGENMRATLGDILFGVRFPLMSMDFFENRVGTSK